MFPETREERCWVKVEAIALGLKRRAALVEKFEHQVRSVSINIGARRDKGDEK